MTYATIKYTGKTRRDLTKEDFLRALEIIDQTAKENGFTEEHIRGPRRLKPLVDIRRELALRFHKENYSLPVIGIFMNRDHTTILNLLKKKEQ